MAVARHFVAAEANDIGDAFVVRGQSTQRKIFVLENSLERRAFFPSAGIGFVAAIAVRVVDLAARGLLRVQAKLSIRLASLNVARRDHDDDQKNKKCSEEDSLATIAAQLLHPTVIFLLHQPSLDRAIGKTTNRFTMIEQSPQPKALFMTVVLKRVYESASRTDGTRVLVDRLWPRGIAKANAAVDEWLRDLAPSDELRRWFHARAERWQDFRKKYLKELSQPEAQEALVQLYKLVHKRKRLTLLFASKNEAHNNAVVLKELIEEVRKPPTGTGPAAAHGTRKREAAVRRR